MVVCEEKNAACGIEQAGGAGVDKATSASSGPALDWVRIAAGQGCREQWCSDGDGMVVVKRCAGGYRALDQNQRKYIGRFLKLDEAISGAEKYMKEHDPGLYEYVLETWPAGSAGPDLGAWWQ